MQSMLSNTVAVLGAIGVLIASYRLGHDHGAAQVRLEAIHNGAAVVEKDEQGNFLRLRWRRRDEPFSAHEHSEAPQADANP